MNDEAKPDILFIRPAPAPLVTFHNDGRVTIDDKFKDQPEEAARLFLEAITRQWKEQVRSDGWICRPNGFNGQTAVCDDLDKPGWERIGYTCRPFVFTD